MKSRKYKRKNYHQSSIFPSCALKPIPGLNASKIGDRWVDTRDIDSSDPDFWGLR